MRFPVVLLAAVTGLPAAAQNTINIPLTSATAFVGLGTGGGVPGVLTGAAYGPAGETVDNLQPGSYGEWKVNSQTPGLYRIAITLSQWQDDGCVLAVETRPFASPENPYSTRYAAPDTRDYGQTNGVWAFLDTGDLEDDNGNPISIPLWSGDSVLRIQNVTGRHHPAYTYPPDMGDPHNRDWGTFWGNVHIGHITLTRVGDLPAMGSVSGRVTADRPYGLGVKSAFVLANSPGQSPVEPSWFWKNGWYTCTHDDGAYTLTAPVGPAEVKAGRPGGYQVQGSPVSTVDVPDSGSAVANCGLTSLFHDDGAGNQVAFIQAAYFDSHHGNMGLLSVDGENGRKMGWIDTGDTWSAIVDAPRSGAYKVRSVFTNGGSTGTVRVSTDTGASVQGVQLATTWDNLQGVDCPGTLSLRQGPNVITQSLLSGTSDYIAIHLTAPPVVLANATRALQIAAGLVSSIAADAWLGEAAGDASISVEDAVRLLQAATGRPL